MDMSETASTASRPNSPTPTLPHVPTARLHRFQWESGRRGPGSVISETTESRAGDYWASPGPGTSFYNQNFSISALPLGSLPQEWSSSKHGFHAISTVLNNPHKRQAPPKAHSHLPTVAPADLPRVKRKDFDAYLKSIGPEWETFEKSSQLGTEGSAQLDETNLAQSELGSEATLFTPIPDSATTPRTPRAQGTRPPPSLDTVPSIFFQSEFNLGEPRTFAAVTELGQRGPEDADADPAALEHALPLIERLSAHADTVEQHLVREVARRSTSFFAALSNLQDLQTESAQCLERIAHLRKQLAAVDDGGARKGLEAVRRECRARNVRRVRDGVKVLGGVVEMTGIARSLVNTGRWGEALTVVEQIETLWDPAPPPPPVAEKPITPQPKAPSRRSSHTSSLTAVPESPPESPHLRDKPTPPSPPPPIPLSSLNAFSSLPEHLRTLTVEIATTLSSEFVGTLRTDLADRIDADFSDVEAQARISTTLGDKLRPILDGLARTKGIRNAVNCWRDVALGQISSVIQRHLPFFDPDKDDATASSKLHAMGHPEFLPVVKAIYRSLLNCVEGLQMQNSIVMQLLASAGSSPPADLIPLQEDLADVLSSAAELSNLKVARVLSARSEQHTALDLAGFSALFHESWSFVVKCEVICRRMIVGLRGVVVSQAKSFLQSFHQARISQSAKLVEDELWNAIDVPRDMQHLSDLIVHAAVSDSAELKLTQDAIPSTSSPDSVPSTNGGTTNGAAAPSAKHLRIEDHTYYAVSATLQTLVLLVDYLRVVQNLSTLTTDTMSRVIEFLKAFNSRTCQVVLGAGAMRSAGLKNITAKHLALASQSLSIMITLVPYVREMFRRHLSPKQAVMLVEFDKLKRDYQEHQDEIHTKLIAIMGDRLSAHIRTLQVVDWNVPKKGVNDYMELLLKETITLHKVLSRYLSMPIVEYVMSQVFASINHRLAEEYGKIELPTLEAKEQLLTDARYLHSKLSVLKNVRMPTNMLETVVSEKRVAGLTPASPAPSMPGPAQTMHHMSPPSGPTPTSPPASATGTGANARIKGMFARAAKMQSAVSMLSPSSDMKGPLPPPPPEKPPLSRASTDSLRGPPSRGVSPAPPERRPTTPAYAPVPRVPTPQRSFTTGSDVRSGEQQQQGPLRAGEDGEIARDPAGQPGGGPAERVGSRNGSTPVLAAVDADA